MKRIEHKIKRLLCTVLLLGSLSAFAQTVQVLGGDKPQLQCVTEKDYQDYMRPAIEKNIARLREEGKLHADVAAKMGGEVKFAWPLRMTPEYQAIEGVNSYFYIGNFADLNHDEYYRTDWQCNTAIYDDYYFGGAKNYDGHNGADIVPYPFPWQMMDDESVDIIAAADGQVIHMYTGNTVDRNCDEPHTFNYEPFNGGYYGNFIALLHDDMSITVYAHMKTGTVADLEVDDYVVAGQYLGKMGSSGNSSAPHIHFEFRPTEYYSYQEPWYDPEGCNDELVESRWIDQIPYYEPEVLRVSTHNALPVFKTCAEYEAGSNETVNFSNHFTTGEVLMISVAMRDFFEGDDLDVDIISSAGVILQDMDWVATSNYYKEIFLFTESLTGYATGTYKIRVTHQGKFYYHYFTVNCPAAVTLTGTHTGVKGYLNGDYIASTATISGVSTNDVLYEAENYVKLNVGFKATMNCEFKAQVDPCTIGGLKDVQTIVENNQMSVYPNPNFGNFELYYYSDVPSDKYFLIRNLVGEIIYSSSKLNDVNLFTEQIDLSDQAKGIYLIEFYNGKSVETAKVVVQ
ncbi:MAG: peptidoglycan DD-metalloendopeptidase family protein [Bacteroidetes bacterium]|jgi:murein DD-endopeptidase MepM/ murein hydrolase activator NlpD|nr:peptidoglycan DD-metalloendopeptidase family protein [Bacteroidota bacterium]MBP8916277.1 peptidoglycan DD-metalloendopeptidase family protein [Chitinophagales bacterium]MBP9795505.1 peptidoglycan DD-metalloendopeptidase family protein [Chitinophagales bacterium]